MCIWRRRLALRIHLTPDTCSRERPKEKKSQEKIDPSRVSYMITCCLKSSSVVENSERLVVQIEFQGKNKDNVMATSVHPDKFRGESLELEREQELSDEDKLKVKTELFFLGKETHTQFISLYRFLWRKICQVMLHSKALLGASQYWIATGFRVVDGVSSLSKISFIRRFYQFYPHGLVFPQWRLYKPRFSVTKPSKSFMHDNIDASTKNVSSKSNMYSEVAYTHS